MFRRLVDEFLTAEAGLAYRTILPQTPFLAFGSHVDTDALASAAASGCDPVMPRSKFSAELPDLIRRYFEGPGPTG